MSRAKNGILEEGAHRQEPSQFDDLVDVFQDIAVFRGHGHLNFANFNTHKVIDIKCILISLFKLRERGHVKIVRIS
jgi:hypothetical protein